MPPQKIKAKSSQDLVPIKEIRENVIIMEDNSMRMILMASSLNFSLKSAAEQEAVIMQYQEFLNSLDFSLQFCIQSRRLNIEPYLDSLKEAEKKQVSELLKIQTAEYVTFVKNFVEMTQIVAKTFYIVIPFVPGAFGTTRAAGLAGAAGGIFEKFFGKKTNKQKFEENKFEEYKSQLQQRAEAVIQGLIRTGVRAVLLNTEELIELFYGLYNPGETQKAEAQRVKQ